MFKIFPVLFVLLLASCSTQRTNFSIDKSYDFSDQESFSWAQPPIHSSLKIDPKLHEITSKNILPVIENNLLAKGYSLKQAKGDLTVSVDISSYSNVNVQSVKMEGDEDSAPHSGKVTRALIKVFIKDSKTGTTVYSSEISDIMSEKRNRVDKLRAAIFKLMQNMPKK
ncbi:MAG: DUF4136 domain-containing protein [Lentisphaerales bacterium]|nr:DUF4136 domain-containing protein [Lentisphaerales bacterium]